MEKFGTCKEILYLSGRNKERGSFKLVEKQGGCLKCDSVYDSEKRGSLSGWFGVFKGY